MSDSGGGGESAGTRSGGVGWRLVLALLVVAAIGVAFAGGLRLGREEAESLRIGFAALAKERDGLAERIGELEQEAIVFERTRKIDLEANQTAQEDLKKAQDERLALEKEVSFLRRLIQEGGGGFLRIQDLKLTQMDEPGELAYSFTVSQIMQDFGESEGMIELKVAGRLDGEEQTLPLSKLTGSEPTKHAMKFRHFQSFEGRIRLPDALQPQNLVIEIKPTTSNLPPLVESYAWSVGD